jgi:L-lactate dehydrogenase complex protein LldG
VTPREEVLARIRAALGSDGAGAPEAPPAAYRTSGDLHGEPLLDLLAERLAHYRASVRRSSPAGLGAAIAAALAERGARRVVVPEGLDLPPLPGVDTVTDHGLSPQDLDALDGVITGASVAIAQTGTIVLDGSPDQGRRAITLVPDYHLCVVHADQVVELVPEAVGRLEPRAGRPLTWISGPSATSDIELSRVEGVHGPRTLEVILVESLLRDAPPALANPRALARPPRTAWSRSGRNRPAARAARRAARADLARLRPPPCASGHSRHARCRQVPDSHRHPVPTGTPAPIVEVCWSM